MTCFGRTVRRFSFSCVRWLVALCTLVASLSGCAPQTAYRNAAMIPAAHPVAWSGHTVGEGKLRIDGNVMHAGVVTDLLPSVNQSALHVPETTVEGSAGLGLHEYVEIGARVSYAAYRWAERSAVGTAPIIARDAIYGVGPELRVAVPLDKKKRFVIGGAFNALLYQLPYSRWENITPAQPCTLADLGACGVGWNNATYKLTEQGSSSRIAWNAAITPSITFDPRFGYGFLSLGAHSGYKNDGFALKPNADALSGDGFVFMLGVGYALEIEHVRLSGLLYKPLVTAKSPVNYLGGGMITLGFDFDLWERHEHAAQAPGIAPPSTGSPLPAGVAPPPVPVQEVAPTARFDAAQ
jgi:hypothetical protein